MTSTAVLQWVDSRSAQDDAGGAQGPDEVFDGAGNKIEVKKSVTMTEKAPGDMVRCGDMVGLYHHN